MTVQHAPSQVSRGGRPSQRQAILQRAIELAKTSGPESFTLDSLCEYAKISKGGILYHFPSVPHLVSQMFNLYLTELGVSESTRKTAAYPRLSLMEATALLNDAPLEANFERLVVHTLFANPEQLPFAEPLRRAYQHADSATIQAFEQACGARLLRVMYP